MESPLLVIVTGPPAAGKTTVARGLASGLGLPLLEKDTIKEALFDALGAGDLEWSQLLGGATFEVIWALLEQSLRAGAGMVVEANFIHGEHEGHFEQLPSARVVQVHCEAPLATLLERYRARRRHPGHVDSRRIEALQEAVESGRHAPLDLPGETIRLETSEPVDLAPLLARVRRAGSDR